MSNPNLLNNSELILETQLEKMKKVLGQRYTIGTRSLPGGTILEVLESPLWRSGTYGYDHLDYDLLWVPPRVKTDLRDIMPPMYEERLRILQRVDLYVEGKRISFIYAPIYPIDEGLNQRISSNPWQRTGEVLLVDPVYGKYPKMVVTGDWILTVTKVVTFKDSAEEDEFYQLDNGCISRVPPYEVHTVDIFGNPGPDLGRRPFYILADYMRGNGTEEEVDVDKVEHSLPYVRGVIVGIR